MRGAAGHPAKVARECADVGSCPAGDRNVDTVVASIANGPLLDVNRYPAELERCTLSRRVIRARDCCALTNSAAEAALVR